MKSVVMKKNTLQTVQQWGNSLAVRIPAAIARSARFAAGQPVEVSVKDGTIIVKSVGVPMLSLEERLRLYDPAKHGGEVMAAEPVGVEFP
jgi:antitoxin MazE